MVENGGMPISVGKGSDENFRKVSQSIDNTIKNIDNMVKISRNIDVTVKNKQVKIDARTS
jgi:hypothetical protein